MQLPVNITYRGLDKSEEIEQLVTAQKQRDSIVFAITSADVMSPSSNRTTRIKKEIRIACELM